MNFLQGLAQGAQRIGGIVANDASRAWAQVNPLDHGATWNNPHPQAPQPTANYSSGPGLQVRPVQQAPLRPVPTFTPTPLNFSALQVAPVQQPQFNVNPLPQQPQPLRVTTAPQQNLNIGNQVIAPTAGIRTAPSPLPTPTQAPSLAPGAGDINGLKKAVNSLSAYNQNDQARIINRAAQANIIPKNVAVALQNQILSPTLSTDRTKAGMLTQAVEQSPFGQALGADLYKQAASSLAEKSLYNQALQGKISNGLAQNIAATTNSANGNLVNATGGTNLPQLIGSGGNDLLNAASFGIGGVAKDAGLKAAAKTAAKVGIGFGAPSGVAQSLVQGNTSVGNVAKNIALNTAQYGAMTALPGVGNALGGAVRDAHLPLGAVGGAKAGDIPGLNKVLAQDGAVAKLADNPSAYFNIDKKAQMVPVKDLVRTHGEETHPGGVASAEKYMQQALNGQGGKRAPILAHQAADGKLNVLDGNSTTAVAQKHGFKEVPVHIVKTTDLPASAHVDNVKALIKQAHEVNPAFQQQVKSIADAHGLEHIPADPKGIARTLEKVITKYGGDHTKVGDTVRATIPITDHSPGTIQQILDHVQANHEVHKIKNADHLPDANGYADTKAIIKMPNGHKGEVIIATPEMLHAKKNGGHDLYKISRDPTKTPAERVAAGQQMQKLYADAQAAANKRLASAEVLPKDSNALTAASSEVGRAPSINAPTSLETPVKTTVSRDNPESSARTLSTTPSSVKNSRGSFITGSSIDHNPPNVNNMAPKQQLPEQGKVRGFTTSVKNSTNFTPELKTAVDKTSRYQPISDQQAIANAQARLKQVGIQQMHNEALDALATDRVISKQDMVNAGTVLDHLDASGRTGEAQALHELLASKGTAGGQQSQAFATILKRNPNGLMHEGLQKLESAGVTVTDQMKAEMAGLRDAIKNTPQNSRQRAIATGAMDKYVGDRLPNTSGAKWFALWRAGLLTGARTLGKIVTSHIAHAGAEGLSSTIATGLDRLIEPVSGVRSRALTTAGAGRGFTQGLKDDKLFLKTGIEVDPHKNITEFRKGANFGVDKNGGRTWLDQATGGASSKVLNTYTSVGRLHGAVYRPFNQMVAENQLESLARVSAHNKGLVGDAAAAHIAEFMKNPPSEAVAMAKQAADEATFQQATKLGEVASALQQKGGMVGKVIAPFTRIPSAIATDIFNYSPAGAVKTIVDGIKAANSKEGWSIADQRAFTQGLGRSIVGVGAMVPGMALYNKGLINLGYPTDKTEQKLWQVEGRTPNSILIGGKWRSLGSLGPIGAVLEMGGAIADASKKGQDPLSAVWTGLWQGLQTVSEQSYLAGTNAAVNAIKQPGSYAGKLANQYAGSVIPTLVSNTAQATDHFMRRVDNPIQAIENNIPGVRENLAAKLDSFGNKQPTPQEGNPLAAIDPFYSYNQRNQNNPLVQQLRTLQNNGQGIMPTTFNKVEKLGGVNVKLTPDQQAQLQTAYGQAVQNQWNQDIKDPNFQAQNDIQKNKTLGDQAKNIENQVKQQFSQTNASNLQNQIKVKPGQQAGTFNAGAGGGGAQIKTISGSIPGQEQQTLKQYNTMTKTQQQTWLNTDPSAAYNLALAQFDNSMANGSLSLADQAKAQYNLAQLQVGSQFDPQVRQLYGLNKSEIQYAVNNSPNGDQLLNQLVDYGNALQQAGVGTNKLTNSKGQITLNSKSSGRGSAKVKTAKAPKARTYKTVALPKGVSSGKLASFKIKGTRSVSFKSPKIKTTSGPSGSSAGSIGRISKAKLPTPSKQPAMRLASAYPKPSKRRLA